MSKRALIFGLRGQDGSYLSELLLKKGYKVYGVSRSSKKLNGLLVDGDVYDCGNKTGHLIANLAFSIKNKKTKKEVLKYLNR